jgi:site-specific DNA-methyltransferase (cytosine-N4-specific)
MIDPAVSAHYTGDCRALLKQLPDGCVQTCVTSPPYWGLRDYDTEGQIGLEDTPEEYVAVMVEVFEEVRRVLKDDGTLWLNLGDSYSHGGCGSRDSARWPKQSRNDHMAKHKKKKTGLKPKDLIGIPWMTAFALRNAGWYLRMDNIWSKPNPMPESVTDRTTKAHEYLFHFSKSESYYYDADAIRDPLAEKTLTTFGTTRRSKGNDALGKVAADNWSRDVPIRKPRLDENGEFSGANKRSVWTVRDTDRLKFAEEQATAWSELATYIREHPRGKHSVWPVTPQPYAGAHFATFPPDLIEPCILACSRVGDLVLDPFFGSGTTGQVAEKHERLWIGFDLNPKYAELAKERTAQRSLPLSR